MPTQGTNEQRFRATVEGNEATRAWIVLPFDPSSVWGERAVWHVAGSIGGCGYRGTIEKTGQRFLLSLGPAWRRDRGVQPGDDLDVVLHIEGPQRADLAPDIAAALDAEPEAGAFFDSIAQFYRKGFLRWIDATKRSPDVRAERIAEMVRLLKEGRKQRPG